MSEPIEPVTWVEGHSWISLDQVCEDLGIDQTGKTTAEIVDAINAATNPFRDALARDMERLGKMIDEAVWHGNVPPALRGPAWEDDRV